MGMVFCRGCGKEIHSTAITCPQCGAPQGIVAIASGKVASKQEKAVYTSYDQVPWYRKRWFTVVSFLIFSPALWVIFFTGDVYYESKGELKTFSIERKVAMTIASVVLMAIALFRGK